MRSLAVFVLVACSATAFASPQGWKYLDDGSDQGTAWIQPGFDDSAWQSGTPEFGYGDGDEQTLVDYGPNPVRKYITTYYRIEFDFSEPLALLEDISLDLIRDDGAVVYLNGVEIARSNMPAGPINYLTLASSLLTGSSEQEVIALPVDQALWNDGVNTLAAEVHQFHPNDPDLSFSLASITALLPQLGCIRVVPGDITSGSLGRACAVFGDTAVVGAPGSSANVAYVRRRNVGGPGLYGQVAELRGSDSVGGDEFGEAVDIEGTTVVVAAPGQGTNTGAVYVFDKNQGGPGGWGEVAKLTASDSNIFSYFGETVALEGDTIYVGASGTNGATGSVYIFDRNTGGPDNWGQAGRIDSPLGPLVFGVAFGSALAVDGDTLAVASYRINGSRGEAFIFERSAPGAFTWDLVTTVEADNGMPGHEFGFSLDLDGDTLVVGAPEATNGLGRAYMFERNLGGADNWGQAKQYVAVDVKGNGRVGFDVAISGDRIVIGIPFENNLFADDGEARLLERDLGGVGNWGLRARIEPGNVSNAYAGHSVAIAGDSVVVGVRGYQVFAAGSVGASAFWDLSSDAVPYCTAGTSASGCTATLAAIGAANTEEPYGFALVASGVEGDKDGLFFFSTNGRQANVWGNGTSYQCVAPPVFRAALQFGTGTPGQCDGVSSDDLSARWTAKPAQNPGPGATVQAQFWYRDPQNTSNQTTSLSNAIEFTTCP